jgi:hypothetical protein
MTKELAVTNLPGRYDSDRDGRREPFSMVPRSLGRSLPAMALKLFVYLEECQFPRPYPVKYAKAAEDLGWKRDTVRRWAQFLARHGIIEVLGEGRQARRMHVIHNPARPEPLHGPVRLPKVEPRSDSKGRPLPATGVTAYPRRGQPEAGTVTRDAGKGLGLQGSGVGSGLGLGSSSEQDTERSRDHLRAVDDEFGGLRCRCCGEWRAHVWNSEHACWYCADCAPFVERAMARPSW